jgi:hypothetical protein
MEGTESIYCVCCGRPFTRTSQRGPAPLYCSQDCRRQIQIRRRVWAAIRSGQAAAAVSDTAGAVAGGGHGPVWTASSRF